MNNGNVFLPIKFEGVIRFNPLHPQEWEKLQTQLRDVLGVHFGKTAIHVPVMAISGEGTNHSLIFLQPETPIDYYQMVIEWKKDPKTACLFLDSEGKEIQPVSSGTAFQRFAFPNALVVILWKNGRVRIFWTHLQIVRGMVHYREEIYFEDVLPVTIFGLENSLLSVPPPYQEFVKRAYHQLQKKTRNRKVSEKHNH